MDLRSVILAILLVVSAGASAFERELGNPEHTPEPIQTPADSRYGEFMYIDGEIHDGQAELLEFGSFKGVKYVVLNSKGGSGIGGEELARVIREQELATIVPAGGVCASACMFAFQAGVQRIAYSTSMFMYHGPRFTVQIILGELEELCNDKGLSHCREKALEIAYKKAVEKIDRTFAMMIKHGMSQSLPPFYMALPDEPKKEWLNEENFIRKPDLIFVDDLGHRNLNSYKSTYYLSGLNQLLRWNVITELVSAKE